MGHTLVFKKSMDLPSLITQWMNDNHPDITVHEGSAWLAIKSDYLERAYEGDVWYVCRIDEDRVHLFNPAKAKYGAVLMAGVPTFFEQLDAVIRFYKSYVP